MDRKLQFQGEKSPSFAPKIAITCWYILCFAAAVWPTNEAVAASPGRQAALLACVLMYIARAAVTLFVFVKREIPWWEAAWGGIPIGLVIFFSLRGGLPTPGPPGFLVVLGGLLYVIGSYLGTASEWQRHLWKAHPGNRGHLYTEGLFRHARHINYFGDLLLFCGYGILTQLPWMAIVPLAMALNFVFFIIPAHDAYLTTRYDGEFEEYARRTRKLVPLLY